MLRQLSVLLLGYVRLDCFCCWNDRAGAQWALWQTRTQLYFKEMFTHHTENIWQTSMMLMTMTMTMMTIKQTEYTMFVRKRLFSSSFSCYDWIKRKTFDIGYMTNNVDVITISFHAYRFAVGSIQSNNIGYQLFWLHMHLLARVYVFECVNACVYLCRWFFHSIFSLNSPIQFLVLPSRSDRFTDKIITTTKRGTTNQKSVHQKKIWWMGFVLRTLFI